MIAVEFQIDTPILQESLTHAPEMIIRYEEMYQTSGEILFLFWATDGDLAVFEDGLNADPTVTNPTQLAETQTRRLYRVTFTDYGEKVATFPAWPELNMSLLSATTATTHKGWVMQMQMSGRETLKQYRKICTENNLNFRLKTIYEVVVTRLNWAHWWTVGPRPSLPSAFDSGKVTAGAMTADPPPTVTRTWPGV